MATSGLRFSYKERDLLFFDELKKNLEDLVCPVCHEISSDPVQTSCCGHLFCKQCLKGPSCPYCRQEYTSMPDQFNTRKIKSLKVECNNKGCDWKGELGQVVGHFEICMYETIPCPNKCGEIGRRIVIAAHMLKECPFRTVKCKYCKWKGKANELPEHITFCPAQLIPCPDGCDWSVRRDMVETHSETCTKRLVKCKYYPIGCRMLLPADKMADHLVQGEGDHLEKAMSKVVELSVAMGRLSVVLGNVCQEINFPCDPQNLFLPQPWLENTTGSRVCPCIIEMSDFSQKHNEVWFSPPFYTHPGGYKVCLEVYGNGYGNRKGSHLSVFIRLMKGENDDNLMWPFSLRMEFKLLNQMSDSSHVSQLIDFSQVLENTNCRVIHEQKAKGARGRAAFLPLTDLVEDGTKEVQFLKNDSLFFKVNKI